MVSQLAAPKEFRGIGCEAQYILVRRLVILEVGVLIIVRPRVKSIFVPWIRLASRIIIVNFSALPITSQSPFCLAFLIVCYGTYSSSLIECRELLGLIAGHRRYGIEVLIPCSLVFGVLGVFVPSSRGWWHVLRELILREVLFARSEGELHIETF